MNKGKKFLFALLTIIISLVAVDLFLHATAFMSTHVDNATRILTAKIPDKKLGHRPNPAYPDHDANGFRNPSVPETVDIVALGDSQTYGSGVKANESWPRALESLGNRSVYNMGLGGYGPVHSLLLWDEAMERKPSVIIEALYAGNDLYDAFTLVYTKDKAPTFISNDKNLLDEINNAEKNGSIGAYVSKMYRRGKTKSETRKKLKTWFTEYSRVYGLIRRIQYEISRTKKAKKAPTSTEDKWKKAQRFANKHSKYAYAFSNEKAKTVFTSEYRLAALNLDDMRIQEGKRIALEAIKQIQARAKQDGVRFIVLLIPTKEFAFSEQTKEIESPNYYKLLAHEEKFWTETKAFLTNNTIEFVDSLPNLQQALNTSSQPYMVSRNGHPNAAGQKVIAETVNSYLISTPNK